MDSDLELKAFIEAMKKNGCPMWMFERDEDGNFEDMTMAHSWYAWQEKAKAQAVPEDYCLVPKVPTEKMFQAYERYSVAPMSTLSKTGYKAMIEASESGAEG
ncbi:hypothetical protein M211_2239 [Acinetobacter lactucae]|nr:hypothetical protein M211_2239 [Acinetobacter lactucae]